MGRYDSDEAAEYERMEEEWDGMGDRYEKDQEMMTESFPVHKRGSGIRSQILLLVQSVLCLLVIGAALIIKMIGGQFYADVAGAYFDEYHNSVFTGSSEPSVLFQEDTVISEISKTTPEEGNQETLITSLRSSAKKPLQDAVLTSGFGQRRNGDSIENHQGIDLGADRNTPITAVFDGEVVVAECDPSYGNYLILSHQDQVRTLYAHCEKLLVQVGDTVQAGEQIAYVGETGDADGCHLHLELIVDGKKLDPMLLFGDQYG